MTIEQPQEPTQDASLDLLTELADLGDFYPTSQLDDELPVDLDDAVEDQIDDQADEVIARRPNALARGGNWLRKHWKGVAVAGSMATATAFGATHSQAVLDIDYSLLKEIDISTIGRTFIDAAEAVSPVALGGAGLGLAAMTRNRPGRTNLQLAWRGLAPNKHNAAKRLVAGAMLPALGIGAISNALMIESAIHKGANPNIISTDRDVTAQYPGKQLIWNMEAGTHHFMDDSQLSHTTFGRVEQAIESGDYPGVVAAQPFYRDLVTIPTKFSGNQAGMVFSVPAAGDKPSPMLPTVKAGAECKVVDERCALKPNEIIIDEGEGFKVGDTVKIRDHEFTVVAFPKEDQSLVNRLIAYTGVDEAENQDKNYFGFASVVDSKEAATKMIADLGLTDQLDQETTPEFLEANDDFWYHNGTTLLFLLIADITLFGGATFATMSKNEQERNTSVIATMRAFGTTDRQLVIQQQARAAIMTGKGIIPGAGGAVAATAVINKALVGFHGETSPKMIAGAAGIILLTKAGATAKNMRSMRNESIVENMKQK